MLPRDDITGLVLAGGAGRRMGGGDKGLAPFLGRPMVAHSSARLRGRVGELIVSANRHVRDYGAYADRVLADALPPGMVSSAGGFNGPLAGLYTGMSAARTPWLALLPCDTPALPDDVLARLSARADEATDIVVAHDGERPHYAVALLRTALTSRLGTALEHGERSLGGFYAGCRVRHANMADCAAALANVNTPEALARLEAALIREAV